jgi:cell division septation protein DedD
VQLSSQKTEADAQASYRVLQSKYPALLGNRQAIIRRVDLGEKGVFYRAQVGPFASADEASDFCGSLKAAGGQCLVQKN